MSDCSTCTRRELLRGVGAALAGSALVSACGGGGSAATDAALDSPSGSCPSKDTCLDTTMSQYAALASPGGSAIVTTGVGSLVVVRTSATAVAALSSVCTHAGCTVQYSTSNNLLNCPCHGAQFSLTGAVVQGPAAVALQTYTASVSGSIIEIVTG